MVKGRNDNHPRKDSIIKVGPFKSLDDIKKIKRHLKDNPRNLALFVIGINTNLRASDLIRITVGEVKNLKPMDEYIIREQKTGKVRVINMNESCIKVIQDYLDAYELEDDDTLFLLTVPSVHRLVKTWAKECGIEGHYGSHSLRKTFGFHKRVTFGFDIPTLMTVFNHSNQKQTLDYLCIQAEEVREIYAKGI